MIAKMPLVAAGAVLFALGAVLTIQGRSSGQVRSAEPGSLPAGKPGGDSEKPKRAADDAAVRNATADLAQAVEKGDAKSVAASWTEEGEYIGEDGTTLRGRAAIEAAYAKQTHSAMEPGAAGAAQRPELVRLSGPAQPSPGPA